MVKHTAPTRRIRYLCNNERERPLVVPWWLACAGQVPSTMLGTDAFQEADVVGACSHPGTLGIEPLLPCHPSFFDATESWRGFPFNVCLGAAPLCAGSVASWVTASGESIVPNYTSP